VSQDVKQSRSVDRLGFLLARHGAITNVRMRDALSSTGLSPRHAMTLMHLSDYGPVSQQALIEALGVDPSVIVGLLNDLERDGLARRDRDPGDRRRHIVKITDEGLRAVGAVDAALTAVEAELFTGLSSAEVAQLHGLLARICTTSSDPVCQGAD
jgi:DNA-binding MarR family transcriptional regulator